MLSMDIDIIVPSHHAIHGHRHYCSLSPCYPFVYVLGCIQIYVFFYRTSCNFFLQYSKTSIIHTYLYNKEIYVENWNEYYMYYICCFFVFLFLIHLVFFLYKSAFSLFVCRHDITEILLKVVLYTITLPPYPMCLIITNFSLYSTILTHLFPTNSLSLKINDYTR